MKKSIHEIQKQRQDKLIHTFLKGKTLQENYLSVFDLRDYSWREKIILSKSSIQWKQVKNFLQVTDLSWEQLADLILMTTRNIHLLRKKGEPVHRRYADKFVALADFYSHLYNLFKSRTFVNSLVFQPVPWANNIVPIEEMPYATCLAELKDNVFSYRNLISGILPQPEPSVQD